jgi:hypothetical protein
LRYYHKAAKSYFRIVTKTDNKAKDMKPQTRTRFTLSLLTAGILCASTASWAANVPAGTALAEKQELVRNNGSEPASLDPHKVESDVEFNIISDLFEGLVSVPRRVSSPAGGKMGEQGQHRLDVPSASGHHLERRHGDYRRGCGLELAAPD